MNFNELKQWARGKNFDVLKEKGTERCVWTKIDDPKVSGVCDTLKDTATAIFNEITNHKWIAYQNEYKRSREIRWDD